MAVFLLRGSAYSVFSSCMILTQLASFHESNAKRIMGTPVGRRCISSTGDENNSGGGVPLKTVTEQLLKFAPSSLAESWDNVGLLVEPTCNRPINRILLTNDLTEDVMEEALSISANLIISYHPPLFVPVKKITQNSWKERIISKCLADNIAIYSPHTSWDVIEGGVNDWLASAFDFATIKPLIAHKYDGDVAIPKFILTVESTDQQLFDTLKTQLPRNHDFKVLSCEQVCRGNSSWNTKFTTQCSNETLQAIVPVLNRTDSVVYFYANDGHTHTVQESPRGIGRMCTLRNEISIREAVDKVKEHLKITHIQLALARKVTLDDKVKTIALVAGSGGSLMQNIRCDLQITGEASHHQVLDSVHNGASVILTNHSNSERGFLEKFKQLLAAMLNSTQVSIVVSTTDSDPLKVY